ncbi:hypothetical protein B0H11DRAFT_782546, partial [Mycena galericulata]
MDPLKLADLPLTEDWNRFQHDMKGYITPQQLQLDSGLEDLESQIREFIDPYYMHDNNAPFLALSVEGPLPTTNLTLCGETFTVPLSSREMSYLTETILGDAHSSVPGTQFECLSDAGRTTILKAVKSALRTISALRGGAKTEEILAAVHVFKTGSHELSTTPTNDNHVATVFVVLPSLSTPADIRVQATHAAATSQVRLPPDIRRTVSAIGTYTGVSRSRIDIGAGSEIVCLTYHVFGPRGEAWDIPRLENLSGALPTLRDAFCLWRHNLNSGGEADTRLAPALMLFILEHASYSVRDFQEHDATLLCHLAPLSKAYGFTLYIGDLVHTISTQQEVSHPYKEYFGLDIDLDPSELYMSEYPTVRVKWTALRTLGGIKIAEPKLLDLATRMVLTDDTLDDALMNIDAEEDYDILDDGSYCAQVVLKHIRTASVLFIVP